MRVLPKSTLGKRADLREEPACGVAAPRERRPSDDRQQRLEVTVRIQAYGRKNWELLGSPAAGPRAAVLFTILAGAKRHRLEPRAYRRSRRPASGSAAGGTDLECLAKLIPLGREPPQSTC